MFTEFSKQYSEYLFDNNYSYKTNREKVEKFVIKSGGNLLKAISAPMISFMLQTKIKNVMYY